MNFFDMIKKSVVDEFSGSISVNDLLFSLLTAFLISMFIIYIYKKTYSGVVYSKSFSLCILLLAMVTSLIIRTISSNLALSLGMVGALSIVRYRTAVKEPIDTGFMFWGITAGIMSGAGLYVVAIISSLALGLLFYISYTMGFKNNTQYLLIIKHDVESYEKVREALMKINKFNLRSKTIVNNKIEVTFEIDCKKNSDKIVDMLYSINGVENVSLISYQNDFGA
jgi:uncharacterized membrane protein YhiD involved in acid resistance